MENHPFMFETTNQHPVIGIFMVGNPHIVGMLHHHFVGASPISTLTGLWILFLFLGRQGSHIENLTPTPSYAMAPRSSFTL